MLQTYVMRSTVAREAVDCASKNVWLYERACASADSSVSGGEGACAAVGGCGAAAVCACAGPAVARPATTHTPRKRCITRSLHLVDEYSERPDDRPRTIL